MTAANENSDGDSVHNHHSHASKDGIVDGELSPRQGMRRGAHAVLGVVR